MFPRLGYSKRLLVVALSITAAIGTAALVWPRSAIGASANEESAKVIARGGGTTIIHGGGPGFVPVITTIAFHVEKSEHGITGAVECLAKSPESPAGPKSAEFTVNAMYVTGQITGAVVHDYSATFTGMATVTGLGAGSNVPFTFVVQKGGPGTTSALSVGTLPSITFNEILVEGAYELQPEG